MVDCRELPNQTLLGKYLESGAYTDCYAIDVASVVSQAQYVEAFYTTWLFKLERLLLGLIASRPSTDLGARALAVDQTDAFAAWRVEARTPHQLLMCDFQGRTRSWLMTEVTKVYSRLLLRAAGSRVLRGCNNGY